jgi:hypothetical protein
MRTLVRAALAVLLLATGASAVWGGYMLMVGAWEMDAAWLARTPFDGWTLPGLATMLLPGVGVLVAGVAVALGLAHHRALALAAGAGLVLWVAVELVWLQVFHPVMHPMIAGTGLAVLALASLLPRPAGPPRPARRAGAPHPA